MHGSLAPKGPPNAAHHTLFDGALIQLKKQASQYVGLHSSCSLFISVSRLFVGFRPFIE
jgi:hypothetical protein